MAFAVLEDAKGRLCVPLALCRRINGDDEEEVLIVAPGWRPKKQADVLRWWWWWWSSYEQAGLRVGVLVSSNALRRAAPRLRAAAGLVEALEYEATRVFLFYRHDRRLDTRDGTSAAHGHHGSRKNHTSSTHQCAAASPFLLGMSSLSLHAFPSTLITP